MTHSAQRDRAIRACLAAGIPVVNADSCTCQLRGRLVVVRNARGLRLLWPCDQPCPTHTTYL